MKSEISKLNIDFIGNNRILEFLLKIINKENLSGVFIFEGSDNLGKTTLAVKFAQILLCGVDGEKLPCGLCDSCKKFIKGYNQNNENEESIETHGDFHLVKKEKDKKNISIGQIRELIRKLGMSSFLNSYKIGIIKHAHLLSEEAANALLKTLEEPKDKVIVILVTSDIESLPVTIISRSQILKFKRTDFDIIYDYLVKERNISRSLAKNFSRLAAGRPMLANKFIENKDFAEAYLKRAETFLNFFNEDVNGRFLEIGELTGAADGQEAVRIVARIIEIWTGIVRDFILIEYNLNYLIQHEILLEKILRIKNKLNLKNLLNIAEILERSNKYLEANVNPRLVLENIAINI